MESVIFWMENVFARLCPKIGYARGNVFNPSDIVHVDMWKDCEAKREKLGVMKKSEEFWKNVRNVYPDPVVVQKRSVYACLDVSPDKDPHASLVILDDDAWTKIADIDLKSQEPEEEEEVSTKKAIVYELMGRSFMHLRYLRYDTIRGWKADYAVKKKFIPIGETELSDDQLRMLAIWCKPDRYTKLFADCMTFVRTMASEIAINENGVDKATWQKCENQIVASQNRLAANKENWKRRGKPGIGALSRLTDYQKWIYRFVLIIFLMSSSMVIFQSLTEEEGDLRQGVSAAGEDWSFIKCTLIDSTKLTLSLAVFLGIPAAYFGYKYFWQYLNIIRDKMWKTFCQ